MKHLRRHLSVANVLSAMALFVALSGAAYAATQVKKNSIKTRHLGKGAVTTQKLRNGAVNTSKLRNRAVTAAKLRDAAVVSSKLADGSVRSVDLGGGVVTTAKLKSGAVNADRLSSSAVTNPKLAGDSVTTGKIQDGAVTASKLHDGLLGQLVQDVTYEASAKSALNGDPKTITAACPSGREAIGGGHRIENESAERITILESLPVDTEGGHSGWTVKAVGDGGAFTLEVHAVCAEL